MTTRITPPVRYKNGYIVYCNNRVRARVSSRAQAVAIAYEIAESAGRAHIIRISAGYGRTMRTTIAIIDFVKDVK